MTLPRAERIIDNLVETFKGIKEANGCRLDVNVVENRGNTIGEPSPTMRPYVGVYDDGEERSITEIGLIRWIYPITVVAHVNGSDYTSARSNLADLVYEIRRLLYADPTRGIDPDNSAAVNAVKTGIIRSRRRLRVPNATQAAMEMNFEVEYYERPEE